MACQDKDAEIIRCVVMNTQERCSMLIFDKDKKDLRSVVMNIEKRCSMSSLLSWQFPEGEDSAISKSLAEKEYMKNHN